jgi:hypothetical protein
MFVVRIPLVVRCTRYNIMWSLSGTCNRFLVFVYSGFLHNKTNRHYMSELLKKNRGVKHYSPNPDVVVVIVLLLYHFYMFVSYITELVLVLYIYTCNLFYMFVSYITELVPVLYIYTCNLFYMFVSYITELVLVLYIYIYM